MILVFLYGRAASGPLAGLFYGLGVRLGDRYDSFCEIPREELDLRSAKIFFLSQNFQVSI